MNASSDQIPYPHVALKPYQPKLGHRLPEYLPVVVRTTALSTDLLEIGLRAWLRQYVVLATLGRRRKPAKVLIVWADRVEELDMDARGG